MGSTARTAWGRRNVKEWRETNRESSDGYLRLEWDPGVMQVDFGVALADVAGVERTVHFLVATLPYSNMRYAVCFSNLRSAL